MNNKQLAFAREYRGLSQSDLAKSIDGLSQSNLSKFEKGFGVLSIEVQTRIANFLNFPEEFYNRRISTIIENANYRKRSNISKSLILQFETKCKLIGYIVDEFAESVEWPEFKFLALNVEEGYSPKYIANYNRKLLKLTPDEPVSNIIRLFENFGVIVYEIYSHEKFDGLSFITDKGFPIIVINKWLSNDRKRFTLAHELGHILMHNENNYPVSPSRPKEVEANEFAGEFLMPEQAIKASLVGLRMSSLSELKIYWQTSMSSIIRRAKNLGCIGDERYRFFMIEMSRLGYTKKEPIELSIDEPSSFLNAMKLFKEDLNYSINDFVEYLALPEDILNDLFPVESKLVKLKILN